MTWKTQMMDAGSPEHMRGYAVKWTAGLSSSQQMQFIQQLPVALAVMETVGVDPRIFFVNAEFTRLFGCACEDIPRLSCWMQWACPESEYRAQVVAMWNAARGVVSATDPSIQSREFRFCDRQGRTHDSILRSTVLNEYFVVTLTEVTRQPTKEEVLQATQTKLEKTAFALTENIPVGTYTMVQPADGGMASFAFMSRRFLELTGLTREEAAADPLKGFACVHPDDFPAWVALNVQAFTEKTPFFGETRLLVDGEVRWITAESIPRPLPDGSTVWEGVLADITQRKYAELALLEAKQRAEQLERMKSEFLTNMSHEIRTPMNAVIGLTQLLLREPLPPRHEKLLRRIDDAGQLLLILINDILDLSKIEAGKMQVNREPFVLQQVLERVQGLYAPLLEGRPIELVVDAGVAIRMPQNLLGDEYRIEQILANLLGNAIKYTERGVIRLSVRQTRRVDDVVHLRFTVQDTGSGIAASLQSNLFEPFTQGENDRTAVFAGTGLGLSISKRLVELLDGEMGFSSTLGRGSTFWFELPLVVLETTPAYLCDRPGGTSSASPFKHGETGLTHGPMLQGLRILVVDDNRVNRELLAEFIAVLGGISVQACNGQEALQMLREAPDDYAAVLMDVQMPVLNGLETTRQIRMDLGIRHLPVVAVTAGVFTQERETAMAAGMNDVLLKPLRLQDLAVCLCRWLGPAVLHATAASGGTSIDPVAVASDWVAQASVKLGEFAAIAAIDQEYVWQMTGGDAELFAQLLAVFREEYGETLESLQSALALGERQEAARQLHALRGAAASLGARRLAEIAHVLEGELDAGAAEITAAAGFLERMALLAQELQAFYLTGAVQVFAHPEAQSPPD